MSYFEAMSSKIIGWVALDDNNTVLICDYENNFSRSSKRRAQTRLRVARHRAGKEKDGTATVQTGVQERYNGVTQSVTDSVSFSAPTATVTVRKKSSSSTERLGAGVAGGVDAPADPPDAAAAADVFLLGQHLPEPLRKTLVVLGIALNRRSESVAALADRAWGQLAPQRITEITHRYRGAGKGMGVVLIEVEAAAHKALLSHEAAKARQAALADASPLKPDQPTPAPPTAEALRRGMRQALVAHGWRRVRRAVRQMNLHKRPNITLDLTFQGIVLRAVAQAERSAKSEVSHA